MGEVWKAFQPAEQRIVALKFLRDIPGDEECRRHTEDRFRREISLAAQCSHPALVRIYGSGRAADKRLFYVMEWIDGVPLTDYLRNVSRSLG